MANWLLEDGTPNWELYPDATHYCPESEDAHEAFLKVGNDNALMFVSEGAGYLDWTEDCWEDADVLDQPHFIRKA